MATLAILLILECRDWLCTSSARLVACFINLSYPSLLKMRVFLLVFCVCRHRELWLTAERKP